MISFKIGSYEIIEPLGQGTVATTWLARDDRGKLAVAKRLFDPLAAEPAIVERFLAAVESSSKIRMKKHVATVLAQKHCADGVFLLRQHVEGESLARCAERGQLSALERNKTDQIARDLCDAVRALASRGVVHGGLHPGNVIIQPDGRVKVTDFGIGAAMLSGSVPRAGSLDTLAYAAPEQWRGAAVAVQTDIYGVAAIVHLVDRGIPVFRALDCSQLEREILAGRNEACPVLAAALDPEPARRYGRIEELVSRLAHRTIQAPRTPLPRTTPPPASSPSGGKLAWIFDVRERRNLLEASPPRPWTVARDGRRVQRPLQVTNSGPGNLELSVSCAGDGLSASPARLTISPAQMGAVMVRLEPDSAKFANLIFRWNERDGEKSVVVKIIRRD